MDDITSTPDFNLHLACIRTRLHNLTGVHIKRNALSVYKDEPL